MDHSPTGMGKTTFGGVFRKFVSYYRPYRRLFYFDLICAGVLACIDLAFPQILNALSKGLFTQPADVILSSLTWIALGMLVLYIVRYGCQYFIISWGHIMGARMESDMRQDLFDQYQRLSFSYYDRNNTGEMMSKLVADLFDISELAHHGPEIIFISVLKIVGSFFLLFFVSVKMTLVLLVITVVMVIYSLWKNRRMQAVFLDNREKIARVNSRLQDTLAGIRVVKSFANEETEHRKFRRSNVEFLDSKTASYLNMGSYHAKNGLFMGLLYTAVIVSGGYLIAQGEVTVTDLALFALYITIFVNPLDQLLNFTESFQKGYSGFRRFYEVLETKPDITEKKNAADLFAATGGIKGAVRYDYVSFSYDGKSDVLHDLDLTIDAGKTIALVGPSGGGKTTICSLLPRFYDVRGGTVSIDGVDIRDVTLASLRSSIGIVQQDVYLFEGSIRENISYGRPGATDAEIEIAARNANLHEFIERLDDGYDTFVGERGTRLSGGQKQRVAIARVFLRDPRILIFDEATSALDNESESYIQASLERLAMNRTTIVIAHRLSTIRNADEIVVIKRGTVRERGTHAELIAKGGIYAKYYLMQFEGIDDIVE